MSRKNDLECFYAILDALRVRLGGYRYLNSWNPLEIPRQGVYFFFENGEFRDDGRELRVVRVGTHAVSAGSRSTLKGRLRQHRGHVKGPHAGGGNHRSSIFRRHVGAALLEVDSWPDEVRLAWHKSKVTKYERGIESCLEREVSTVIRSMPYLFVEVNDEAGPNSRRRIIEANSIGLLSNLGKNPTDPPSPNWLGLHSPCTEIRESGLWNIDCTDFTYDPQFLKILSDAVKEMDGRNEDAD